MSTAHNQAQRGEIAPSVLLPGDPLRAKFIAENYLQEAVCYNTVRNMLGYTGFYRGKRVSVQGSGMGVPSMGIYAQELFAEYDVQRIIRIGSAGAIAPDLQMRDLVIGMGACTTSNFAAQYQLPGTFAPIASPGLLLQAVQAAQRLGVPVRLGNLLTVDAFYDDAGSLAQWQKMGVLAVEMETAGLYMIAARMGRQALTVCTVSDTPLSGGALSAQERETSFRQMMEIALEIA